jgi:cytochrome b561
MNWKNTTDRYGSPSIAMHWLMLALLVGVYACINVADAFPKGSDARANLKTWHYMLGLGVFALVVLRLATRAFSGPAPAIEPRLARWQQQMALVIHLALYFFMIVMPLLGWLTLSAKGEPIPFFGLQLPPLIGQDRSLAHSIEDIHETRGHHRLLPGRIARRGGAFSSLRHARQHLDADVAADRAITARTRCAVLSAVVPVLCTPITGPWPMVLR